MEEGTKINLVKNFERKGLATGEEKEKQLKEKLWVQLEMNGRENKKKDRKK